jgi:hypothetical protein
MMVVCRGLLLAVLLLEIGGLVAGGSTPVLEGVGGLPGLVAGGSTPGLLAGLLGV